MKIIDETDVFLVAAPATDRKTERRKRLCYCGSHHTHPHDSDREILSFEGIEHFPFFFAGKSFIFVETTVITQHGMGNVFSHLNRHASVFKPENGMVEGMTWHI